MEMQQEPQQVSRLEQILAPLISQLKTILISSDFIFTEFFNGLCLFLWGAWVASPHWDTFNSTPTYDAMAQLPISEDGQGIIIMSVGLIVLFGTFYGQRKLRKYATFWATIIWIFISAMFIVANFFSTATVVYPMLALSGIWAYWRITVIKP